MYKILQNLIQSPRFDWFPGKPKRVKTPTVLQMEAVECGAAALSIILSYYGRIVPLAELRQQCGVSRDGSKASNILKAARNYGLIGKGFKKDLIAIQEVPCPYIVFWNFNHFLVVERLHKNRVDINDPATGPRTVSFEQFDEAYTGVMLLMEPGPDFEKGGRKPSVINALWERLQGSLGAIAYLTLAGFLLVIPGIALPAFTQVFIDNVLIQGRQEWLRPLLVGMIMTAGLRGLLAWLQLMSLRGLKVKLAVSMSSQFLWHILRLPVSFYTQRFAGEIAYRLSINDKVADVLSGRLTTTVIDVVMMFFYALVMYQYDGLLTAIGIISAVINLYALQALARSRVDANMRLLQEYSKVAGVTIAGIQSMETLKASALESDFFARWSGYYTKAINAQQELDTQNQILGALPTVLSALTTMLLLVIGGLRVMDGKLSIGMLIAFQSLMQSFLEPVSRLINLGSTLQELTGDLERLNDALDNEIDPQFGAGTASPTLHQSFGAGMGAGAPPRHRLQGYVELQNVTFGYSHIDPPLIENFSLKIEPGERVALVGASGSGKSTVAKLVTGLYEPWAGEIYFDGKLRSQIPRLVLVNSLAMVDQDILLFGGTIRENLTLWDNAVPYRNLVKACQDAVIDDVLRALPGGYEAELLEGGANLSGGQRQRLEIARALVYNPSILVLDEATSALDAENERIIDQNLRRRGCTCIIVAHRLSSIRDCDQILVFDGGKVVERGTHEELWQRLGLYSKLLNAT